MLKIKEGFRGERLISLPSLAIEELKNDELGKELYLSNMGYYPNAKFHYCEKEENEPSNYILVYCTKGEGWLEFNHKKSKVYADQFFILPKEESYAYGSSKENPWSIYWIYFDGKKAEYFSRGFCYPQSLPCNAQSKLKNKLDLFEEIFDCLQKEYSTENMLYASSVLFHFLGSIRCMNPNKKETETIKESNIVEVVLSFMQENMHKRLTLQDIASHVNLSISYFSRIFIAQVGTSPSKYLTQLRMKKACNYLEGTDMKVNQISPLVGFDDPLYFSRLFTIYLKQSPTKYREAKCCHTFFLNATQSQHHIAI
ncbi:AraC family transcriptional regulator [Bacteroides sp.]